jgi:hypothetical protein
MNARRIKTREKARESFEAIRRRHSAAQERLAKIEDALRRKYGQTNPPSSWMTAGEYDKRERAQAAVSKEWDKMFDLLDDISPRSWRSGVAAWWIVEKLSFEDATTLGPLSETPQPGHGTTIREVERFAQTTLAGAA